MADKTTFTAEEWATIRNAPTLVGLVVAMSGASGLGTIKETFATMQGIMAGAKSDNALVRALATPEEVMAAQEYMRGQLQMGTAPADLTANLRKLAFDNLGAAIAAIKAKAAFADVTAYGTWIMAIGTEVAGAAKEGGFLGIGGERISAPEKAALEEIKAKLA
jgi:hypothetical protein